MSYNKEELQDFLDKVEDVNKTVQDLSSGKMSVQDFDKKYKNQEILKHIKEEENKQKLETQKKMGRKGKGQKGNYIRFCKACFVQYQIDVQRCSHCGHTTISAEQRKQELQAKLQILKQKKKTKLIRKARWENWVKTQSLFYKKTATNYRKWDFYDSESDQDQQNKEPILPNDDPNFKAMQADMNIRSKRRKAERKTAMEFKVRGNDCMKKGLFRAAIKLYSDGLEHAKDIKQIWTNRALARLKIEQWEGAMDDCTRVLEYCQVLQEGFEKSADICCKGFLRRGMSLRGQQRYEEAIEDFKMALKLFPDNDEGKKWLQRTEQDLELEKRAKKIMENKDSLNEVEFIDTILKSLQDHAKQDSNFCSRQFMKEDQERITKALKQNEDLRIYFNKQNGLRTLIHSLKHSFTALRSLLQLIKFEKIKQQLQTIKGYETIIDLLYNNNSSEERQMENQDIIQCLELLQECSLNQFVRKELASKKKVKDIFLQTLTHLKANTHPKILTNLISFISNLCYAGPKMKEMMREQCDRLFIQCNRLFKECSNFNESTPADEIMSQLSLLNFIANIAADLFYRTRIAQNQHSLLELIYLKLIKISKLSPVTMASWGEYVERITAILINCSIGTGDKCIDYCVKYNAVEIVSSIFAISLIQSEMNKGDQQMDNIMLRCMAFVSKLCKSETGLKQLCSNDIIVRASFDGIQVDVKQQKESCEYPLKDSAIKIFAQGLRSEQMKKTIAQQKLPIINLVKNLKLLLIDAHKNERIERFINLCAGFSAFVDTYPDWTEMLREIVPLLIQIVKEKVDLIRKNAAILLAKLAKNEKLEPYVRELHGIDVLMSIGKQVADKN